MKKQDNKNKFRNTTIGRTVDDAIFSAERWGDLYGFSIRNVIVVKKPSWLGKILYPFISGHYVISFDVITEPQKK